MREIIFRELQEEDLPAVLDTYNHYIAATTATFDPEPVSMETLRSRILLNHHLYKAYVVHHAGEYAGFCFLSQFKKHESYDWTAELGIYLRPEHTRYGLGTRAISHLERVAAEKGLKVLIASISGENMCSINLFRKLGWQECAHFQGVGQKWGRALDVIFFQKLLERKSKREENL